MKTLSDIVDDIFVREGDVYRMVDQPTGRGGITLPTLTAYMRWKTGTSVSATLQDLQNLTHTDARAVIEWFIERLMEEMKILGLFEPLKLFLLDFGYQSGGVTAIRWLQRVLFVTPDGIMGPETYNALSHTDNRIVLQALVGARLQMIRGWAKNPADHQFEDGIFDRILSFSLLSV